MNNYVSLDQATLNNLKYYMPENDTLRQLANIFCIFCDYTRLKILSALSLRDMCVSDLCLYLNLNQTTVSHQLRTLKDLDAVIDKREGKIIVYSIKKSVITDILSNGVDFLFD